jgi:hypothetical protein
MSAAAPLPPLAFCALKYLLLWLQHERSLHLAFAREPSSEDFRQALRYFRISRNFKGITADRNLLRVRALYLTAASSGQRNPEELVGALATAFKKKFGKFNVSAASKLLWLAHRTPFIVLDSRAVRGLKRITGERFTSNNYTAYSTVWRRYYQAAHKDISAAASLLPRAVEFLPASRPSESEIGHICTSEWFLERVLDIFLWGLS